MNTGLTAHTFYVSTPGNIDVMPIRVAIVEDDEVVRESLAVLIGGAEGFSCTGTYASGEKAVEGIPLDAPDVVLMDIRLSRMSGIDCVRRLREVLPSSQIIMLTMFEDDKSVFDFAAGRRHRLFIEADPARAGPGSDPGCSSGRFADDQFHSAEGRAIGPSGPGGSGSGRGRFSASQPARSPRS